MAHLDDIRRYLAIATLDIDTTNILGDNGDGYGNGYGHGTPFGMGSCSGDCLCSPHDDITHITGFEKFNGEPVHVVNGISVIFRAIHLDIARVDVIQDDLSLKEQYIFKVGNCFAFGDTIEEARNKAREEAIKYECSECSENYAEDVVAKYPDPDEYIPNMDLFKLHNVITGSCLSGREEFFKEHGYTEDGMTTMREFLTVTKDSFGGFRIRNIAARYGIII